MGSQYQDIELSPQTCTKYSRKLLTSKQTILWSRSAFLQVAGLLLRQWLASAQKGQSLLGIHPVSGRVANQSHAAIAVASLKALQAFAKVKLLLPSALERAYMYLCSKTGLVGINEGLGSELGR